MISRPVSTVTALVALVAASTTLTACSSSGKAKPSPSPSSSILVVTPTDAQLQADLIAASDIPISGFTLKSTTPTSEKPAVGVTAIFASADSTRVLSDIVLHLPSVDDAQSGLTETQSVASAAITHNPASNGPLSVGQGGEIYIGSNDTGPLTIATYSEGPYIVTIEFASKKAGDQIPEADAIAVAKAQDAKLKGKG